MKKVVLAVLAVMCVASFSFAGNFGLGIKAGAGENDWKVSMWDNIDKNYGFAGAELLYEFGQTGSNRFGLKVGFDVYQQDKASDVWGEEKVNTFNVPVTIYYKWDRGVGAVSYFLGAGFTYVRSIVETGGSPKEYSKSKGLAHGTIGAEYRFSELFALGVDATYNFGAKLDEGYVSDHSGFRGALVGRFYF